MKFGIFYELQLPRPWKPEAELTLYHNALDQLELPDDQRLACGDTDMGWFICIYDETKPRGEQSEVLARALGAAKLENTAARSAAQDLTASGLPSGAQLLRIEQL